MNDKKPAVEKPQKRGPKPGEGGRPSTGRDLPGPKISAETKKNLKLLAEHWTAQKGRGVSTAEAQEMAIERAAKALLKPSH